MYKKISGIIHNDRKIHQAWLTKECVFARKIADEVLKYSELVLVMQKQTWEKDR
jgi:hypothetical protein